MQLDPKASIEWQIMLKIKKSVMELFETIENYESDTFSASASELSIHEVQLIVAELINQEVKSMADCVTLDGVRLSEELEIIREARE